MCGLDGIGEMKTLFAAEVSEFFLSIPFTTVPSLSLDEIFLTHSVFFREMLISFFCLVLVLNIAQRSLY